MSAISASPRCARRNGGEAAICRRTPSSVCGAPTFADGRADLLQQRDRRRIGKRADQDEIGS